MNLKIDNSNPQITEISIEISHSDYAEKVENALKKERRKAQIPGFRSGNAPMGMIKKMYEKNFILDEVNNIISAELYKYVQDNNLNIFGEPLAIEEKTMVDLDKLDEPFVLAFEIALQPTFDIDFEKLPTVQYLQVKATDKQIAQYIDDLRRQHGTYLTPEEIGDEDFISLQFDESENFCFVNDFNDVGKNLFLGKKVGEEVACNLKDIFKEKEKLARFLKLKEEEIAIDEPYAKTVKIHHITRSTPAELNEEFFQKAFPNGSVTDETQLKEEAAKAIELQWKSFADRQFMNDSIKVFIEHITIDFPDDFLKRFILNSKQDLTPETLEEQYDDYKKSFKWQLIENKIVSENEIQVSQEDIKAYIRQFFVQNYFSNIDPQTIEEQLDALVAETLKKKEEVKNIYDMLFDQKIMEFLLTKMKIKYVDKYNEEEEKKEEKEKEKKTTKSTTKTTTKPKTTKKEEKVAVEEKKEVKAKKAETSQESKPKSTKKE